MATQDHPIEDGHDEATDDQRVAGLIEQVRADVRAGHTQDAEAELRQRLAQAGIELDAEQFAAAAARIGA